MEILKAGFAAYSFTALQFWDQFLLNDEEPVGVVRRGDLNDVLNQRQSETETRFGSMFVHDPSVAEPGN